MSPPKKRFSSTFEAPCCQWSWLRPTALPVFMLRLLFYDLFCPISQNTWWYVGFVGIRKNWACSSIHKIIAVTSPRRGPWECLCLYSHFFFIIYTCLTSLSPHVSGAEPLRSLWLKPSLLETREDLRKICTCSWGPANSVLHVHSRGFDDSSIYSADLQEEFCSKWWECGPLLHENRLNKQRGGWILRQRLYFMLFSRVLEWNSSHYHSGVSVLGLCESLMSYFKSSKWRQDPMGRVTQSVAFLCVLLWWRLKLKDIMTQTVSICRVL